MFHDLKKPQDSSPKAKPQGIQLFQSPIAAAPKNQEKRSPFYSSYVNERKSESKNRRESPFSKNSSPGIKPERLKMARNMLRDPNWSPRKGPFLKSSPQGSDDLKYAI